MRPLKINQHSIAIRASFEAVYPEIIRWGEALWWPRRSHMVFSRDGSGPVVEGTRYQQKVLLPFAPSWGVEVSLLGPDRISRRFLNGMFSGHETVAVRVRQNGVEVIYQMYYQVRGFLNRILWRLFFKHLHDKNIEMILLSLKRHVEEK